MLSRRSRNVAVYTYGILLLLEMEEPTGETPQQKTYSSERERRRNGNKFCALCDVQRLRTYETEMV